MAGVKLGVMGGTFDPVHNGHLALAETASRQLGLREVLWVPAGTPWRKADRIIAAAEHRVEMVRLAILGAPAFRLSTMEVERSGPSYTVDTLLELQRERPGEEFALIVGQDALEDLPNWKEPGRLLELALLAVAQRGVGGRHSEEALETLVVGLSQRVVWLEMEPVDVNATELRGRAAAGQSLEELVPGAVAAYIRENRLYGPGD